MNYESDRRGLGKLAGKFNLNGMGRGEAWRRIFPVSLRRQKVLHTNRRRPNANSTQSPQTKLRTKNYSHPWAVKSKKRNRTRKTHTQPPLTGQYGKNESTTESGAKNRQTTTANSKLDWKEWKKMSKKVFFVVCFFQLFFFAYISYAKSAASSGWFWWCDG